MSTNQYWVLRGISVSTGFTLFRSSVCPEAPAQWLIRPWFARKSKNTFEFIKIVLNVAQMVGGYCVFGIFKKSHFNPQLGGAKFRVFWLYISHFWVFQSILKNYQSLSSQKTGIMVQFDRLIIKCQYMDIKKEEKKIFCQKIFCKAYFLPFLWWCLI